MPSIHSGPGVGGKVEGKKLLLKDLFSVAPMAFCMPCPTSNG